MRPPVLRPTTLEISSGLVLGEVAGATHPAPTPVDPLTALEQAVLPALTRPPCLISFSGGMDSSFLLAVAARAAHRAGLASPIPVTWRFTDAPRAGETPWQDRVIAALRIPDWQVLLADDELDLVGPVAQRLLLRHGVLHPANTHLHLPIMEMAAGGSLLTGWGGDQVLSGWRRPGRRSAGRVLRGYVPDGVAARLRQRRDDPFSWLRPDVSRRLIQGARGAARSEPRRIDRRIRWHSRRRDLLLTNSGMASVAADNDVLLLHPLLDPGFLAALGRRTAGVRDRSRVDLLLDIADGRLDEVATAPRPKAFFREVFFRRPTAEFVRSWDGTGADQSLVNVDVLRELWSGWPIPGGTAGLVQQLWLASVTQRSSAPG